MEYRLYLAKEVLYGAGLYSILTVPPEIVVELRLDKRRIHSLSFNYPGIGHYFIGSVLFTAAVVLTRRFRCHFLILMAWIVLCCVKFMLNVRMQVFTIQELSEYGRPVGPIMATVVFCGIFTMAMELMLHWVATVLVMPAQIVVNIAVYREMARGVRRIRR